MKKIIQIMLVLIAGASAKAQLVPNGSFETNVTCPTGGCQWYNATGWTNANPSMPAGACSVISSLIGTPDYFSGCGTFGAQTPNTLQGYSAAQDGNAMMGLILYDVPYPQYREYLQTQLSCPMIPGTTYKVSFWLNNGNKSATVAGAYNKWTISNIGVYFSPTAVPQSSFFPISAVPQCEITSNVASTSWVLYSFMYTPTSTMNYITFGSFRNDAANNPQPTYASTCSGPSCSYAYYFVDNIQVYRLTNAFTLSSSVHQATCGSAASATVTPSNPGFSCSYLWTPGGYTTPSVSGLAPGVYTVTATYAPGSCNGYAATTVVTINPPTVNPVISVTPNPTLICTGPYTLTASGAATYVWQPGGSTTNPLVVNPSSLPATYTVTGTSSSGCTATAVYTLTASPPTAIAVNISPSVICAGSTPTLTASGPTNCVWQPGGISSNTYVATSTFPASYTVTGSTLNHCPTTSVITLNLAPTVNVSAPSVTYCTNATTGVFINASSTFPGSVSYYWIPAYQAGASIFVSPASTTIYTVTASSSSGCPSSATMAVNVTTACCSQPTTGLTALTGGLSGTYSGISYYLDQDITLTGSSFFRDAEVLVMQGVKITVPAGMTLSTDHTHLYACGINMWQGIVVQDKGEFLSANRSASSLIEDAVVAVDVDNSSVSAATPPVYLSSVIFNDNYIGIKLSNSQTGVTTLPIEVSGCVFSSRKLPFTSPAPFSPSSWPNADFSSSGLRYAAPGATANLTPPYNLQGYASATLKQPYGGQIANTGIQIKNIAYQTGVPPTAGVDIGVTYPTAMQDFNLYDGLKYGINIMDASLTTMNNVFQNCETGIDHSMTGIMNSLLDLRPAGAGNQSTDYGNRFWNCITGVRADNVYEVDIEYGIFRSTHLTSTSTGPGANGALLSSNRFKYDIQFSEFNNIGSCVNMTAWVGSYDMGGGPINGTYADNITVNQNYFGAEVNSTTHLVPGTQYCDKPVTLTGLSNSWQIVGAGNMLSNKVNRSFRGISVRDMDAYPVTIGGNEMLLMADQWVFPGQMQNGVYVANSKDNLVIDQNTISGDGPTSTAMRLILSENNTSATGILSPVVTCNTVAEGYTGFEFSQSQPGTLWTGNIMNQRMTLGLSLTNNGEIGVQGNTFQGCGAQWNDGVYVAPNDWASNFQTYVDAVSNASPGSFLFCEFSASTYPNTNGSGGGTPFANPASFDKSWPGGCTSTAVYPATPSQRLMNATGIQPNTSSEWNAEVFPNPTDGNISLKSAIGNEPLSVKITDVTGKTVYLEKMNGGNTQAIDISSLKPSVYFIEIRNSDNKVVRRKIVKM